MKLKRQTTPNAAGRPAPKGLFFESCGCLSAIVVLFVLGGILILRLWLYSDPGHRALVETLDQETSIPQEWIASATLPPDDVVNFQNRFYQAINDLDEQYGDILIGSAGTTHSVYLKLQGGDEITSGEQHLLNEFMVSINPLLKETSSVVSLDGYTADMTLYTTAPFTMRMLKFGKFSSVAALETARRGDCAAAMELAALPLRYARHETPSSLLSEIIDFSIANYAAQTYFLLADMCEGADDLRRGLSLMDTHRNVALTTGSELWGDADWALMLLRANAFGYPVDLSPQPRSSYYFQFGKILGGPYHEWVLENVSPDDIRYQIATEWMISESMDADNPSRALHHIEMVNNNVFTGNLVRLVTGHSLYAHLMTEAPPDLQEAQTRAFTALANYDLARMYLAERLYATQTVEQETTSAGAPATPDHLKAVKRYLPDIPRDPHGDAEMRFNVEMQRWYSVGPDADDDDAQVLYDVTNGTVSNGDIWLQRPTLQQQ